MPGSMYNAAWYERRIANVNKYRESLGKRNKYATMRTKRTNDDVR